MAIIDRLSKLNTILSLLDRLWTAIGWIGLLFGTAIVGLATAAMTYIENAPWWLTIPVVMLFVVLALQGYNQVRVALSLRGLKKIDIQQFGQECCDFYREFAAFMVGRQDARPDRGIPGSSDDMHREWQRNVSFSNKTSALMFERFGPRAFAIAHQMKEIGITPPKLFHFPHGDHGGVSVYIGIVGELLKKGLLDEAKKLDPNSTWGATFY